jgi:hypothetical protein
LSARLEHILVELLARAVPQLEGRSGPRDPVRSGLPKTGPDGPTLARRTNAPAVRGAC